jgi:D-alanyl-D-alanine carboxypeptidase
MPNPPPEREQDPSLVPAVPRTWTRPVAGAGLVVGAALIVVLIASALAGSPTGGPVAAASPTAPSSVPVSAGASAAPSTTSTPTPTPWSTPTPTPWPTPGATESPNPSPTMDPEVLAILLDGRLEELRKRAGIPGVSVAIVWDDGRRWLGASGRADIAGKRPMTTGTGFALASVSKTMTAAVVLQLVDEGHLSLDQVVAPLLPAYGLDARITVRMLLDHTSGLPDYFVNPKINKPLLAKPDAAWTPERAWSYVLPKRPVPGTVWRYSNSNYLLLGELVEAVTGRSLAVEVRSRLLDPMALETAWYQAVETPRAEGATGYRRVAKSGGGFRSVAVAPPSDVLPFRSVVTASGGAGSMAATALDAARWMGAFAGGRVLSSDLQAAMLADAVATGALGARVPYGLGIQVVTLDGRRALGHSGRYLGVRNIVLYVPEARLSIAVLTNQGTYDPARIATMLLRIVGPRPAATPSPTAASPSTAPIVAPASLAP